MRRALIVTALCALLTPQLYATPVSFSWTAEVDDIVTSPAIPGISFGDTVTIEIIADNGNNSLTSQSWYLDDILLVYLSVGTYEAIFVDDFVSSGSQPQFVTDSNGTLSDVLFIGTLPSSVNIDTFGNDPVNGPRLYTNFIRSSQNGTMYFTKRLVGPLGLDGWDPQPEFVPEPSGLILIGMGFVGFLRRR